MRRLGWATALMLAGYAVATVVGFATYAIGVVTMWLAILLLMPVLFAWLATIYLRKLDCSGERAGREAAGLVACWIAMSFVFDAITYIVTVPAIRHVPPNWRFFVDQSPWIWLSYATLVGSGLVAVAWHRRALRRA